MSWFCRKENDSAIEVGWLIDVDKASFIWEAPRLFHRELNPPESAKAAQRCPAINDCESRFFEVLCPVDLHLSFTRDEKNRPAFINKAGALSSVSPSKFNELLFMVSENRWRYPDKPLIQIITPYRFVSDDIVYANELPAFLHYHQPALPGITLSGRLPIHIWPRQLQWAFEWHDTTQDLILKRGDPWFTLFFETTNPTKHIKLVEAKMTDALRNYCNGLDGVTNYVNKTFSLFKIAAQRRPKKLLQKKT